MKKKVLVLLIIGCVTVFTLFALVLGGTNFGIGGYPRFSSSKPTKPFTSYFSNNTVSKREYDNYRNSVLDYVEKAQTYLDNADNDIKRIKEIKEEVIDTANKVIDEFNEWSRSVTVSSY